MNREDEGNQEGTPESAGEEEEQLLLKIADRVYELMRKDIRLEIARGAAPREVS